MRPSGAGERETKQGPDDCACSPSPVASSLLIGLIFLQLERNMSSLQPRLFSSFLLVFAQFLFALLGVVNAFPAERAVFLRETTETSSTIRPRSILPRWSLTPSCNAYSPSWWWPSATHSSAWTGNQLIGSCGSMPSWLWSRIAVLRWASWSQQPCPVWTWPCRLRPGWWCHSCCWLASSSRWMGGSSKIPDDLRDERCMNTCALFGKKTTKNWFQFYAFFFMPHHIFVRHVLEELPPWHR